MWRFGILAWLSFGSVGCAGFGALVDDDRPPTTPVPLDVQDEIRDARFFLPLPDDSLLPPTGIRPHTEPPSPSSS